MKSIWQKEVEMPSFPSLNGDISTDVLIIGGGIAGILTAYFPRQNDILILAVRSTGTVPSIHGTVPAMVRASVKAEKFRIILQTENSKGFLCS